MTNQAYPSLNDIEPSWADISITTTVLAGDLLDMADCAAFKFSDKLEVGERRGTSGGRVMARTVGQSSQEASMTLYRSGLRRFHKSLMKAAEAAGYVRGNQLQIGLVAFDIMIQHTPPGETEIYQTKIKGCRYMGSSDDMKEGNEADKVEVTLNPIEIVRIIDGKEVVLI